MKQQERFAIYPPGSEWAHGSRWREQKLPNGRIVRRALPVAFPKPRCPRRRWTFEDLGCASFLLGIALWIGWEILPAFFDGRVRAVLGGK